MSGYAEGILALLAINTIFAYGAFLPMSAGQLNLGVAGFAGIGAYISAVLSNSGVALLLSIPCAAIGAALVAVIVSVPVLRTRGIYLALATFALGQVVQATLLNVPAIGGAAGYPVLEYLSGVRVASIAVVLVAGIFFLFSTRFGISVAAVRHDERVADLMGLNTRAFQAAAFSIGAAIAGVGGALYAHHYGFIEAQHFGIGLGIMIVLYAVFGGTQTVFGPIAGAAVFTLLPELLRSGQQWRYIVFAALIIIMMALRPQGLIVGANVRRVFGGGPRA
jgi:branched-chain amino acid transport system permease protein